MRENAFVKVYYSLLKKYKISQAIKICLMLHFKHANMNFFIDNKYMKRATYFRLKKEIENINILQLKEDNFFMLKIKQKGDIKSMCKELKEMVVERAGTKAAAARVFKKSRNTFKDVKNKKRMRNAYNDTYFTRNEIIALMRATANYKIIANFVKKNIKREDFDLQILIDVIKEYKDKSITYLLAILKKVYYYKLNTQAENNYFMQQKENEKNDVIDKEGEREIQEMLYKYGLVMKLHK